MFTKTSVQIGNTFPTVFLAHESNEYFYSLTSVAELIGKPPLSPFQFLKSRAFKAIRPEGFTPFQFSDETGTYTLLSGEVAVSYIMYWCVRGDRVAGIIVSALVNESLALRVMNGKIFSDCK